jgi:hypothetical protein
MNDSSFELLSESFQQLMKEKFNLNLHVSSEELFFLLSEVDKQVLSVDQRTMIHSGKGVQTSSELFLKTDSCEVREEKTIDGYTCLFRPFE